MFVEEVEHDVPVGGQALFWNSPLKSETMASIFDDDEVLGCGVGQTVEQSLGFIDVDSVVLIPVHDECWGFGIAQFYVIFCYTCGQEAAWQ